MAPPSSLAAAGSASSSRTTIAVASSSVDAQGPATLDKGKARAVSPEDEMINSGLHTPPASPLGLRGASETLPSRHGKEREASQTQGTACSLLIPANRARPSSIFSGYPTPESPPRLHPGSASSSGRQRLSPEPTMPSTFRSVASSRRTSDAESSHSSAPRDTSISPSTRPIFGHLRDALDEVDLGDPFGLDLLSTPLGPEAAPTPGLIGTANAAPTLPRLGARRRPYASGASPARLTSRNPASGLDEADHRSIFGGLNLRGVADDESVMARTASTAPSSSIKRSFEQAALSPSGSPSRATLSDTGARDVHHPVASGSASDSLRNVTADDSLDTSTSSMASASSHLYTSPNAGRSSRASNKRQRADSGASSSIHGSISFHEARSTLSHGAEEDGAAASTATPAPGPSRTPLSRSSTSSSMFSNLPAATRIALGLDFDLDGSGSELGRGAADAEPDADESADEASEAEQRVTPHFAPALGSPSTRAQETSTLSPDRINLGTGVRMGLAEADAAMSWSSSVAPPEVTSSPTRDAASGASTDGMTIRRRGGFGRRGAEASRREETTSGEDSTMQPASPPGDATLTAARPVALPSARRRMLGWPTSASSSGVWASDGASTPTTADSGLGTPSGLRRRLGRLSRDETETMAAASAATAEDPPSSPPPVGPQSLSDRLAELQAEVDSTVSELRSWRERNSALIERLRRSEAPPAPEVPEQHAPARSRPVPVPAPTSLRLTPPIALPTPPPRAAAPPSEDEDMQSTVDTTVSQLNRWRERSRQLIEQLIENEDSFGLNAATEAAAVSTPAAPPTSTPSAPTPSLSGLATRRGMSVASRLTPSLRSSVPLGSSSTTNRFARSTGSETSLWGELAGRDEASSRESLSGVDGSVVDATPTSLAGRRAGALGASGRLRGPTRRRNEDWLTSASASSGVDQGGSAIARRSTVSSLHPAASSAASSSTSLELPQPFPAAMAAHRDAIDVPRLPDIRSRSPFAFDFADDDMHARSGGASEAASAAASTSRPGADDTDGSSSRRLRLRTLRLASRLTNTRSNSTDSRLPSSRSDPLLQLGETPNSAGPLGGSWTSSSNRYPYRTLGEPSSAGAESSEDSSRDPFTHYREVPGPSSHGLRPLRTPARLARRERLRDALAAAAAAEEGLDTTFSSTSSTTDSFAPSHSNAIDDLVEQVARRRARRLLSLRDQHSTSQDEAERRSAETQPLLRGPPRGPPHIGTRAYSHGEGPSGPLSARERRRDGEWLGPTRHSSDILAATATGASRPEVGGLGLFGRSSTLRARPRRAETDLAGDSPTTRRELLDDSQDSASEDEAPATLGHGDRERDNRTLDGGASNTAMNRFMARLDARSNATSNHMSLSRHILASGALAASESRARAAALASTSRNASGRAVGGATPWTHPTPPWRPQSGSSSTSSSTAAASSTAGNAASSAASTSSTGAARWDRLLDSGFGGFGNIWDSSEAASSLSNSLGLPRLLLAELGAGDVAGNPGNYMNDDEWLVRDSYEGLLRLSERIGDVKPKHTPTHVIDGLPTCEHSMWFGGSCKVEEPEVRGKGKGVDRGEARKQRQAAAALLTDRDQQCPICLEEYTSASMLMSAPCNHAFHESCLRTWLSSSQSCPMCRQNVQPFATARQEAALLLPELNLG